MKKLIVFIAVIILALSWGYSVAEGSFNVTCNATLVDWTSLEELDAWMKQDHTPLYIPNGCLDSALEARDNAERIGKRLETESLTRYEYVKYYNKPFRGDWNDVHVVNKAYVISEHKYYFVDVPLDKRWYGYE